MFSFILDFKRNNDMHYLQVEYMRAILKNELELPVIEISDESATLDGGDVLFTGENKGLEKGLNDLLN